MKKRQIIYIHGGETHRNKKSYIESLKTKKVSFDKYISWSADYLDNNLFKHFDLCRIKMPLKENSSYNEWKIWFERHIHLIKSGSIMMGYSLGAIFLIKYLSENSFPKKIKALYLIAPPYDNSLPIEDLAGGFNLKKDLSLVIKNCRTINMFFSEDDNIVPLSQALKYKQSISQAKIMVLNNKNGHFRVSKFPELIKLIKSDCNIC